MRPVRFSEHYRIMRTAADDWFDPLITEDTALYVDPFLIFGDTDADWANGHARLMSFFNMVLEMLAETGFQSDTPLFTKAKELLLFPEPPEFCLGVSEESIFGRGSARVLQQGMLKGAAEAINLGIDSLKHFEEIALFGEQIGADRVGDITCDVLKAGFVKYTQAIAQRHSIPMERVNVKHADWDPDFKKWKDAVVDLPLNPYATEYIGYPVGVILTPRRFLRRLPTIDPQEFWDYAFKNEGEQIRADLNYEIGQRADSVKIAQLARRRRRLLEAYLEQLEAHPKPPYDVEEDPDLVVWPSDFAKRFATAFTTEAPKDYTEFVKFVEDLIANFKHCVEQLGGWELLWVGNTPRKERQVQRLFQVSAAMSCREHDVDLSPESNVGRGPVDFKVTRGAKLKALLEMKLAKSSSFRRNLSGQTAVYLKAERCDRGYFIVVQFTERDLDPSFVRGAEELAANAAATHNIHFKIVWVNARPPLSASNV